MSSSGLAVVQGAGSELAGACVWWELAGRVLVDDLAEELEAAGLDQGLLPRDQTPEVHLLRAAQEAARGRNMIVRPLSRGAWEVFEETVVADDDEVGLQRALHRSVAVGRVVARDGARTPVVRAREDRDQRFVDDVLALYARGRGVMTASDVSTWLLSVAQGRQVAAVSLRQRGGFYFLPRGPGLELWRAVYRTLAASSQCEVHELPVMHTEEAAAAVLASLRREADEAFAEMDAYLAREQQSVRGLNSLGRRLVDTRDKLARYGELLQADLSDLLDRVGLVEGATAAARVAIEAARDAEAAQ